MLEKHHPPCPGLDGRGSDAGVLSVEECGLAPREFSTPSIIEVYQDGHKGFGLPLQAKSAHPSVEKLVPLQPVRAITPHLIVRNCSVKMWGKAVNSPIAQQSDARVQPYSRFARGLPLDESADRIPGGLPQSTPNALSKDGIIEHLTPDTKVSTTES
jgi:hypothetical protein